MATGRYRCRVCGQLPAGLEFESDRGECPRCGRSHFTHPYQVHALVDVHFIVLDPTGPITGGFGRQHVACQPRREHLALHQADEFAATDHPEAVTCPACRRAKAYREMVRALFPHLGALAEARKTGVVIDGTGCCG